MRILQIYKDYPPVVGGIEHHLRDLSEGLAQRGHTVTVLATSRDRQSTITQPTPGLTLIRAARSAHLASTPLSVDMLRQAMGISADLIHLHFPYPPGDLTALLVPNQLPLVVTYHSDIVRQQLLLRAYRPLLMHTLGRAQRILATSPAYIASSPWLARYAAKCTVVPLGVDLTRFGQAQPTQVAAWRARFGPEPIALFVGRLRYYKGLHVLLEALPSVPGLVVALAGTGPEQERLATQAHRLGIQDRVRFLGNIPDADLPALYQASDMFVLPSHLRAEAFGISLTEALASGLPAISTELGTGTSFVNQHGQTGIVVPPNDPVALARALTTLTVAPELRHFYGANARARIATHFTRDQMIRSVEQVYREVLSEG
jgi:rhamnosyl/mannosyltransferase